jgi:uncharacterized protein with ATP-grasp and redox domains
MRVYLDCIGCFVRQALDAARLATEDERIHEEVIRGVLRMSADLDMSLSPPAIGQKVHRLIRELTGKEDPYRRTKSRFNELALGLYPGLRKWIESSEDRLETAVRLAIAGNIIDLGVKTSIRESDIEGVISDCLTADFDRGAVGTFRDAVDRAESILYLTDNAGEIVLDRLLLERLPIERITVAVKGAPIINDATMEDALVAGLARIVEVIDNGSNAPGTILEDCSRAFRDRFEGTDLVIAKGQGNYETLSGSEKNIFFILKVKCPVIARDLGCEIGRMILRKSRAYSDIDELVKEAE